MNRISRRPAAFSKVSVKSQTVIPREVREHLKLKPGDTLRYRYSPHAAKASLNARSPGAPFSMAMMARRWLT